MMLHLGIFMIQLDLRDELNAFPLEKGPPWQHQEANHVLKSLLGGMWDQAVSTCISEALLAAAFPKL